MDDRKLSQDEISWRNELEVSGLLHVQADALVEIAHHGSNRIAQYLADVLLKRSSEYALDADEMAQARKYTAIFGIYVPGVTEGSRVAG